MKNRKHAVVVQCWEINGIPDGYTLHLNEADRETFIERVKKFFKKKSFSRHERSIPKGEPFEDSVDTYVFSQIQASIDGIHEYPEDFG